jgi:hypothetical protein
MIHRNDLVGQRIASIVGDPSLPDPSLGIDLGDWNCLDLIYVANNGRSFRMPIGDPDEGDILPAASPTALHDSLSWPKSGEMDSRLWNATIIDILVRIDISERFPDSGLIELSSGWFISQLCAAPPGIMPNVDLIKLPKEEVSRYVSVWS